MEISKIIDRHRAEVVVTCDKNCWCWRVSEAIRKSVREPGEITMPTIDNVRCGWKGKMGLNE